MGLGWLVSRPLNRLFGGFFWLFNLGFKGSTHLYTRIVGLMLRVGAIVLLVYGGLLYLTYWGFINTPTGFIPSQDMGYLLVNVQLPDASSAERTQEVMERLQKIALKQPGIKHTVSTAGQSFLLSAFGSNFGSMFIILDDFAKRRAPELYGDAIANNLRKLFSRVTDAQVAIFPPPPVRGVGRAGGFKIMIEDRSDAGPNTLQGQTDNLVEVGNKATLLDEGGKETPALVGLSSVFRANVPQLFADVDRIECMSKDVALRDLFETLQVYLGSLYVNDFNRFGRTWQVIVQADPRFRNKIEDVRRLKVRNSDGLMVPLGSLASVREINGPLILMRYNMYPASFINGNAAKGVSSGQAIAIMEQLAKKELLGSMATEWTELSYLELQAGNTAMIVFGFAVVMVFLVLAALYESWALPLAIILVVPMCLLSAIGGVRVKGEDINIFTQIGFVVLVGLASKNAILIVEFAKANRDAGMPRHEATLEACRLRLRPIIMTSFAFILGVVPLLVSLGAGAEMRRTLGTTVFSGMLGVTMFGIFLTPIFFFMIDRLGESRLFTSRFMRALNAATLSLITLGFVRDRIVRPRRPSKPAPPRPGIDKRCPRPAPAQSIHRTEDI
ncbi:MAG: efflux RND transporter permease subunit [Planctomycetaceae bacterium]|nr:efflux RND transporter permease subunit [Planctomycetaceae bacterium]